MNENRAWWPMAKPWMNYLARSSFLLQQGNFVADVLYFYGDSVPNFVPPKHIDPSLGFGYDYDVTNTEMLMRLDVSDEKLTLPHGQSYQVLVLPDFDYIELHTLQKIEKLVKAGATVIGSKPIKTNSLINWQENDKKVKVIANKMWGKCDGINITENRYGKGKIVWGKEIKEILKEKNICPDFDFVGTVPDKKPDFIHRRTKNADIYFVRNTLNSKISGDVAFRISDKTPELWSQADGTMSDINVYDIGNGVISIPLTLNSDEAVFIVFAKSGHTDHITKISKDNIQLFPYSGDGNNTFSLQEGDNRMTDVVLHGKGEYTFSYSSGTTATKIVDEPSREIVLSGKWDVNFPENKKGVGQITFDSLYSWTESDVFNVKFFSGIATYTKEFELSEDINTDSVVVKLNLGDVREVAHVYVNGKDAGISWIKPNVIDITRYVRYKINKLKIEVGNTWHNRLCGDAKLPVGERITRSNVTREPMAWAYEMKDIPVDKKDEKYGLLPSGLTGNVSIEIFSKY
jgi:hypothetical protein